MRWENLTDQQCRRIDLLLENNGNTTHTAKMLGITPVALRQTVKIVVDRLGFFSRVELMLNWRCEIFQLGLISLGIRRA